MASDKKKGKTLRSDVLDPRTNRYTIRMNDEQHSRFMVMFEESGCPTKTKFILARIFG